MGKQLAEAPKTVIPWHKFPYAIFVGGYTQPNQADPYGIPHHDKNVAAGIQICQMSAVGEMTFMGQPIPAGVNPSYLTINKAQNRVYAVNETDEFEGQQGTGGILSFKLDLDNQNDPMTLINSAPSYGMHPCMLRLDHTETVLGTANYSSGSVVFNRLRTVEDDGGVGVQVGWKVHDFKGYRFGDPHRQEAAHAHSVVFDPDNSHALVCDLGMDKIVTYAFNHDNHAILPGCTTFDDRLFDPTIGCELVESKGVEFSADPCSGPRHLEFHPNGDFVYSVNELSASIDCHLYDRVNGALIRQSAVKMLPPDWPTDRNVAHMNHGRWAADIKIHPNGKFVYASNRLHNSIVCYEIMEDGGLDWLGHTCLLYTSPSPRDS
eukprot:TRINITY_DN9723_c0_g1_i19.p1 TRINITY_DN9723_c0_g1~~TRINITY_DN9723_c0_g1_i19.p1  ORF type:complete len:377 (-),score=76.30 TRINITY_DN9723_c0_g1_i19:134-1264(-)